MNILQGRTMYWCTKLLPKWPPTFTPKDSRTPCHGRELACLLIYWTLVTSFRRNCSTWFHRLPMSTPRFAKFFKPKPMMYQIFLIQKFLFYTWSVSEGTFWQGTGTTITRYGSYFGRMILFWSLRRRLISGNVQAVCHYPKIVYEALGYWPMASGLK